MIFDIWGTGLTDVGRTREQNEDSFLCDPHSGLFIVADGMGGRTLGETASKVVVTLLPLMFQEAIAALPSPTCSPDAILRVFEETLCQLSQELYQQSQKMAPLRGMGSTVTALFLRDDLAYISYAGDSRIYVLRDADLIQLTEDQTTAAALVRIGEMSPEIAAHHPLRNALEEYIGKEGALNPGLHYEKLCVGDRWLLCSDGLTKGMDERAICECLLHHPTPEAACYSLIETAKDIDGTDNITAIVVDVTRANIHRERE